MVSRGISWQALNDLSKVARAVLNHLAEQELSSRMKLQLNSNNYDTAADLHFDVGAAQLETPKPPYDGPR